MEEKILVEGRFNKLTLFLVNFFPSFGMILAIAFVFALVFQSGMELLFLFGGLCASVGASIGVISNTAFYLSDKRFCYKKGNKVQEAALEEVVSYTIRNDAIVIQTQIEKITIRYLVNIGEFTDAWKKLSGEKPKMEAPSTRQASNYSEADELKKYKELLDSGAITREDYEKKKKQLLGL